MLLIPAACLGSLALAPAVPAGPQAPGAVANARVLNADREPRNGLAHGREAWLKE